MLPTDADDMEKEGRSVAFFLGKVKFDNVWSGDGNSLSNACRLDADVKARYPGCNMPPDSPKDVAASESFLLSLEEHVTLRLAPYQGTIVKNIISFLP